jgi:hypothetical protein
MKEKTCTSCNISKSIDNFYKSKRDGNVSRCKPCSSKKRKESHEKMMEIPGYREVFNKKQREYNLKNPRSYEKRKAEWLRYKYNISLEDYDNLLASQNGVCAICQKECKTKRGLAIDHDHLCCPGEKICGKCIRGLLCANCNGAIGMLQEDITILARAVEYLSSAP